MSSTTPDYYQVLNIPPTATPSQIREAYKRAALLHHPDRVSHADPSRAARTQQFQLVSDAYYTLSDAGRRRTYDATRRGGAAPAAAQEEQFDDVFEEMLAEEGVLGGEREGAGGGVWGVVGAVSGAALGFIVGNVAGLVAGAVAGNRLGAVRDRKGKSVHEAFRELPQDDKAKLLSTLAQRILAHAVSS